jgi:RimJ/RimL family protein N-acetyltransferase
MIGDRDFWNKGYGMDIISTLLEYIFGNTRLKRVYLKTLALNFRAQKCFRKAGFKPYVRMVKDGHDFLFMEILRSQWVALQKERLDPS